MAGTPLQINAIGKLLESYTKQLRITGQNIANVNTPGYKRQELFFENELQRVLDGDQQETNDEIRYSVRETAGAQERSDGNNVDIDREMGMLNNIAIIQEASTDILATKLRMLKSAITGQQS